MEKKTKKYIIILVFVLTVITLGITFAYFMVSSSSSVSAAKMTVESECISINYSETGSFGLNYNYPISDDFALAMSEDDSGKKNVTPVTVTVENTCTNSIDYALILSTLKNTEGYVSDSAIKIFVDKNITANGVKGDNELVQDVSYLTNENINIVNSDYIEKDLKERVKPKEFSQTKNYLLEENVIKSKEKIEFNVYLWIDYYEGDKDNPDLQMSTMGLNFSSAISMILNPDGYMSSQE